MSVTHQRSTTLHKSEFDLMDQHQRSLLIQNFKLRFRHFNQHPGYFLYVKFEEIGPTLSLPLRPWAFEISLRLDGRIIVLRSLSSAPGEPSFWPPATRAQIKKARSRTPVDLQKQGILWLEQTVEETRLAFEEQKLLLRLISEARYG